MATVTRTPDVCKEKIDSIWSGWEAYSAERAYEASLNHYFAFRLDVGAGTVTSVNLTLRHYQANDGVGEFFVYLYAEDPETGSYFAVKAFPGAIGWNDKTIAFTDLSVLTTGYLYVEMIAQTPSSGAQPKVMAISGTVTKDPLPSLSVSPSPATVYDIPSALSGYPDTVTLSFGNRVGQALSVVFKYSSTVVWEISNIRADSYQQDMSGFFEAAGATGSSISVRVEVSDGLGRTANASFNLVKPGAMTATATAPKNTTVDGTLSINFAWSVSGDGAQTRAELEWSTDNAEWTSLAAVNGSAQTWTAPALKFPAGVIYWRVRVTNTFGNVGGWSSSVNFTARYDAVSQVVPVNSPTSGIINAASAIAFSVALETTGAVHTPFTIAAATLYWRSGTSGAWTAESMTASGTAASVTIPAGTFAQGTNQWYAEATDNTGRTTETEVFTLTAATSAIDLTPRRPVNTLESGNAPIPFEFGFISLTGQQPPTGEWSYSYDQLDWSTHIFDTPSGTEGGGGSPFAEFTAELKNDGFGDYLSLPIPKNYFSAGTVFWRVRAADGDGNWGEWSNVVSFRVFGAPNVEGVTADSRPFCTVTWQVEGQQAYEIEIDGKSVGRWFGSDVRSFQTREALSNGQHAVRVRAQNRFGLWSEWRAAIANIVNVQGPAFFCGAVRDGDAARVMMFGAVIPPILLRQPQDYRANSGSARFEFLLKSWTEYSPAAPNWSVSWQYRTDQSAGWQAYTGPFDGSAAAPVASAEIDGYQYRALIQTAVGAIYTDPATFYFGGPNGPASELREGEWRADTGFFLVFRDGKLIGKTYSNSFVDRYVVGSHVYTAIQVLKNGYYTPGSALSGFETVTVNLDAPVIFPIDTQEPLTLRLSKNPNRKQSFQASRQTAYYYFAGSLYPAVDVGPQRSLSGSGDAAFTYEEEAQAAAFEEMIGRAVCYRTNRGRMVIGVLDAVPYEDEEFSKAYTFSIRQMEWSDYVEA